MKPLFILVLGLAAIAAGCSSTPADTVANVGGVNITDSQVVALRLEPAPDAYESDLQFLISVELYAQAAEEAFGITVTDADVDAFLESPPPHRLTNISDVVDSGIANEAGVRAQLRRWAIADEVVFELAAQDDELIAAVAQDVGVAVDTVLADPHAFLTLAESGRLFNSWTTELAEAGELATVVVDPDIGIWEPVLRELIPASG